MSDAPGGPGWWRASDGKWYPPETHPDARPPAPPPGFEPATPVSTPAEAASGTPHRWVLWVAGGLVLLLVGAAVLAIASSGDDDEADAGGGSSGGEDNGSFVATASPEPGPPVVTPTSAVETSTTTSLAPPTTDAPPPSEPPATEPSEPPPTEPPATEPPATDPDGPPATDGPPPTGDPDAPTTTPTSGVEGDPELVDDIGPCQIVDEDSFITDVTNGGAERISYVLDYDLVDAGGRVIDTETAFVSPLAPGERALDRQFLFSDDVPADCVLTAVDSFPSPASPDLDHVTCDVTGIDTFDALVVEFTITNLGDDTADYSFSVAIVREGLRRGVSFGSTEALAPGETVVDEGFTFEPGPTDGATCVPIDLFRT